MFIHHDSKSSADLVMHSVLGLAFFVCTILLVAWPEIEAILK